MSSKENMSMSIMLVWPLLLAMFMIMTGNGLQGTLLSLRSQAEGFPITLVGIVMSLYYCGYVVGWYLVPRMIKSVGHIRVFAGFASLASTTILIQGLFVDPITWGFVRILSGVSFVGLFIVAESWLNDIATNATRGKIMSAYFFVINGAFFMGQFLLNLGPIEAMGLFVLVSVLISLSLVPLTLANKPSPSYEEPENLPFKKVISISPMAVAGVMVSGFVGAGIITIGPLYANALGLEISKIGLFIAMYVLGCGTVPLIMGWLSDLTDRRNLTILLAIAGIAFSLFCSFVTAFILLGIYCVGGMVSSIHSISIAMMNDRLSNKQITSATATMILINGMTSCVSPVMLGLTLQFLGAEAFFLLIATIFAMLVIFGVIRTIKGEKISVSEQGDFQAIPTRSAPSVGHISEAE